jgi:hypothetical protein
MIITSEQLCELKQNLITACLKHDYTINDAKSMVDRIVLVKKRGIINQPPDSPHTLTILCKNRYEFIDELGEMVLTITFSIKASSGLMYDVLRLYMISQNQYTSDLNVLIKHKYMQEEFLNE